MKKFVTNSMGVMVLTVTSQILGYVREILFAYYLGTSEALEAFQMAETIPMIFTQILISAVPLALTPLLVREQENGKKNELFHNAIIMFTIIMLLIMVFIFCKTEWFVRLIAPGFDGDKLYITCRLTHILAPNILLLSLAALFNSYLSSKEQFIVPTSIYLLLNIFLVGAQILTGANVYCVAFASLLSSIIVFLLMIFVMYKWYDFHFRLRVINWKAIGVIGKSILPVCLISAFSSLNLTLDKLFASTCGDGSVVVFSYSYKIINIPVFLFTMSITRVMLPHITRLINKDNTRELSVILKKVFIICTVTGLLIALVINVASEPVIRILFGRGAFDHTAVTRTAQCFRVLGFGIIGMVLSTFCQSISYAYGNYFEPLKILIVQIIVYMVIALGTRDVINVQGIALANVVAYSIAIFLWVIVLQKRYAITIIGKSKHDS